MPVYGGGDGGYGGLSLEQLLAVRALLARVNARRPRRSAMAAPPRPQRPSPASYGAITADLPTGREGLRALVPTPPVPMRRVRPQPQPTFAALAGQGPSILAGLLGGVAPAAPRPLRPRLPMRTIQQPRRRHAYPIY